MAEKQKDEKAKGEKQPKQAGDQPKKQAAAGKKAGSEQAGAGKPKAPSASLEGYTPRLRKHYEEVVRPKLIEEFGYKNPMQVPSIEKIVLNMGVGESTADSKKASTAAEDLALIAGQKAVVTRARKAISQFKV